MIANSIMKRILEEPKYRSHFGSRTQHGLAAVRFLARPPAPSSLDYVPPEVVSPETSLLGFFLTEASKRIP